MKTGGIKFESNAIRGGAIEFGVGTIPQRKRPFLYRKRGANLDIMAYFVNEHEAATFGGMLDAIADAWAKSKGVAS